MTKSASEVREELKHRREKKGKGGKHDYFHLKADETVLIRIGPPWEKDGEVWKDAYFHGGFKGRVYCRQNDIDEDTGKHKKCPIEKRYQKLSGDKSKLAKALRKLIYQKSEGFWNVLVVKKYKRKDGKYKVLKYDGDRFKIMRLSYKWQNSLMEVFSDEDYREKSILGVAHPKYGRLIKMSRSGSGRDDTNYTFKVVDHSSPIFEDEEKRKKILKTLVNLDKLIHGSSKDELEAFLHKMEKKARHAGESDGEDESEEDSDSSSDEEEDNESKSDSDKDESKSSSDESNDLEKQYRKMKKQMKEKKKKKHEEDESES